MSGPVAGPDGRPLDTVEPARGAGPRAARRAERRARAWVRCSSSTSCCTSTRDPRPPATT
nr:hypothetical protein [Angustibacter aerolatus]